MTEGSLGKNILLFSIPLMISNLLQVLFNMADIAVVGQFAGSAALGSVGSTATLVTMFTDFLIGLSGGINVLTALYLGAGNKKATTETVHTSLLLSIIIGILLMLLGIGSSREILQILQTKPELLDGAVLYIRIYFLGIPALAVYNFGNAVFSAGGETKRPLYYLSFAGIVNVLLNLFFVIVCKMSVAGVALATMIANAISAGLVVYFLINEEGVIRLNIRRLTMKKEHLLEILRVGVPAGIQGMVFSLSNICIQTGINSFGSAAVAGSASAVNFEFFTYFVTNSFVQATVTFTSQNFGAKQFDRCKKIFRYCLMSAMVGTGLMALVFLTGKNVFIKIYTVEPEVIKFALIRMTYVLTMIFLPPTYEIAGAALRGIGYSMLPAAITIVGCCGFRVVWIYTVFRIFGTFESLMAVYPATWVLTGTMMQMSYYVIRKKVFASKTAER